jgi:hypothetical protein
MKFIFFLLVTFSCFGAFAQTVNVSGRCFYDANGNNIFDGTDSVIANRVISANYAGGTYFTNANAAGQFTMPIAIGIYSFTMSGFIASANYNTIYSIQRTYTVAGSDVVNFAFQKRDSIEEIKAYISPLIQGSINPSGGLKTFKLEYAYDGFLPSIPFTLSLRFNPRLSLQSSSLTPSVSSPGLLQWNLPNLNRNVYFNRPYDSIMLSFNFPVVGDTIGQFALSPKFVPNINITRPYYKAIYAYNQRINHPLPQPIGSSSGVKWLRHYGTINNAGDETGQSIDTTQDGNGYFVAGERYDTIASNGFTSKAYVSKLTKEGLSIWEKNIQYLPNNIVFQNINAIKHTSDGGCLVLGYGGDTSNANYYRAGVTMIRLNQSGDLVWYKKMNGSYESDPGFDIVVLPDGSSMITGNTRSHDGDFVHNNTDTLYDNIFVTKFSASGNIVFTKIYGGGNFDYGYRLVALQNGSFVVMGFTESNDGDVTGAHLHYTLNEEIQYGGSGGPNSPDTIQSEEAWIININSNGGIIWNKCYGGRKSSGFVGAVDNAGGILLTGYTDSKDGDLPYYPEAFVPLWVLQVSATNGSIQWQKLYKLYKGYEDSNYVSLPDNAYDNYPITGLYKTRDGNFITGSIASDKYGSIKTKHGDGDFAVIKLNPTGNIVWQKAIGGTSYDYPTSIVLDKNDDIVFTGSSSSYNDDLYRYIDNGSGYQPTLMMVGKLGITNIIKGQVFVDNNNNHIKDAGEMFYSQGQILSVKGTDSTTARIFDGKFLNNVDTGNFVTSYRPANSYYTVYPATRNSSFATFDLQDSVNFALTPIPGIKDLEIQILPLSTPRPGFDVTYRVITKNVGTSTISNAVVGFKYDSRQTYSFASRVEAGLAADSVWWGPFALNAFDIDTLYVNFTLDAPPFLANGDTLSNTVTANPIIGDYTITNNRATLRERVRGSFDPNDKTEAHAGTLTTTQYAGGEYLQYLIRFQNTGTDTAFFITVKDTLQQKLDLSTLEVLSASHSFTFKLEGQIASWDFKKILLPDSTTDEAGSHGFILFRVKPKTGLAVGDEFTNKAAIYFDYNLPVITNLDKTILGSNVGVCPNGNVSFASGLTGSTYQWQVNAGAGYTNLANAGIYSDVTSSTLRLSNVPTSLRGYRYRCVVNGNSFSPENILRFAVLWTGAASTAWENTANWDCGVLPDAKTDVIIPQSLNYPFVNSNRSCYSLQLSPSSVVTVKTGFTLIIAGITGL